jgi:hypothetical protein
MKKGFVLLVLVMVVLGSCSTKQKFTGTWTDKGGSTWVFSGNGKVTVDGEEGEYVVTDRHLALFQGSQTLVVDFSISADGKTLIMNTSSFGSQSSRILTKK